jgi:hypothetical protein
MDNDIDPQSFERCGQEMFDMSINFTYKNAEHHILLSSLLRLEVELDTVVHNIDELISCLNDLHTKHKLHSKFSSNTITLIFSTDYNNPLRQIKSKIEELEKQLQCKQLERTILSDDIAIITAQLSANDKLQNSNM